MLLDTRYRCSSIGCYLIALFCRDVSSYWSYNAALLSYLSLFRP